MNILCNGCIFGITGARILEDSSNGEASIEIYGSRGGEVFALTLKSGNEDNVLRSIYFSVRDKIHSLANGTSDYFELTQEINALNGRPSKVGYTNNLIKSNSGSLKGNTSAKQEAHSILYTYNSKALIIGTIGTKASFYIGAIRANQKDREKRVLSGNNFVVVTFKLPMQGGGANDVQVDLTISAQNYATVSGGNSDEYIRGFLKMLNTDIEQKISMKASSIDIKQLIVGVGTKIGCRAEARQYY